MIAMIAMIAVIAVIAVIRNELGLIAMHRTFLDPGDALHRPFRKPKLAPGLLGSGCVRFGEPDDVLGLGDGIEDALSAVDWFDLPVWSVLGASDAPISAFHSA